MCASSSRPTVSFPLRLDFDVSHFEVQGVPMEQSVAHLAPLAVAAEVKDQRWRVVGSEPVDAAWHVPGNGEGRAITPDGRELEFQFLLAGEGTFDLAAYLRLMQQQYALDGLELQDDLSLDDHVCNVAAVDHHIVIAHRQGRLPLEADAGPPEFMTQAPVIDRFQQTRSETAVHAHRETDDPLGKVAAMRKPGLHGRSLHGQRLTAP